MGRHPRGQRVRVVTWVTLQWNPSLWGRIFIFNHIVCAAVVGTTAEPHIHMITDALTGSSGRNLESHQHYCGMYAGFYGCSRFVNHLPEDLWLRQEADLESATIRGLHLGAEMGTAKIRFGVNCDDCFFFSYCLFLFFFF